MKITEKNIQRVSDRVHALRQHWQCRRKIRDIVHRVASCAFSLLSIVYAYNFLHLILPKELQGASLGILDYLGKAWEFLQKLFSVPGDPGLSVLTVFLALYAVSFLVAAIAAIVVALKFKKEPRPKGKKLVYSSVSSMVTGLNIYQERLGPMESFHGKFNSILSLAFALLFTGMVAYGFILYDLFEAHWKAFLAWAVVGTAFSWVVHRLLLGLLTFPVALLYCFGAPAPGLKRALIKKAEELKPKYSHLDNQKPYVSKNTTPAAWGAEDYARIAAKGEAALHGSDAWVPSREDLLDPITHHIDVSDM